MLRKLGRERLSTLAFGLMLIGCPNPGTTQQPPDDSAGSASAGEGADEGADGGAGEGEGEGEGAGEGDEGGQGGQGRVGPVLPDGPLCDTSADCGDGQICEGVGCEPGQGRCVAAERMCTRDLADYCGCDGQLFQSSGSCPGDRYAYRGPCSPALEDGEACTDGRQCRSGQCVGEGLEGCGNGARGVCGSVDCTADLADYCGCNNTPFQTSGTCPNRQFAYRGPCEED